MTVAQQQTLDQQRARHAWTAVQDVASRSEDFKKKYGSLARRVPMLILTNGLGPTLAFLRSKGKNDPHDAHTVLAGHLSTWVLSQIASGAQNQTLLDWVLNHDSHDYRRATAEALAYLVWLKRFAEAELPTEED
jgi:CRISPR-associated protein Cmr5